MFERFTNRARHVVVLAQEEARLLSHNYIGTEHILLGLLGEPESVGGKVLNSVGMTLDGIRAEVEAMIGRGKQAPSGHIPFTPRAKKTLELSLREALSIKHNYIGTEHILLGLIREGDGVAVQIMRKHADLLTIRSAVLDAVAAYPEEPAEGAEETHAVLRWLRQRLTGRSASADPSGPGTPVPEAATPSTPAVEAALRQAAALAGQSPIGSHHLLLAALADPNSAAARALAQLGVDVDQLGEKLRSTPIEGTSDELPEQAGRRQMAIQVSDEMLTIVLTDPVIVQAGQDALRVVNARAAFAAAAAGAAAERSPGEQPAEERSPGETGEAEGPASGGADEKSATATVIRGDLSAAAGLADVWLELRKALNAIVDPPTSARRVARARKLGDPRELLREITGSTRPGAASEPDEPDEPRGPEAAS